jgi:hypothetical protein
MTASWHDPQISLADGYRRKQQAASRKAHDSAGKNALCREPANASQ